MEELTTEGNYLTSVHQFRFGGVHFCPIAQAKFYFRGNFFWIQKSEVTKMPNADCGRQVIMD